MTYTYEIGDGAHALDQSQWLDWQRGYQVVDVAGGSNLVDDNATSDLVIRAAAGDINAGGTTVTCTQDTIDFSGDVDPDEPRKVTVYRTPAGALATSAGTPEPAQDAGESRRNAYRPSPPTLSGTDGVVLATVWLPAGASSVTNADIRDRRLPAELPVDSLDAKSLSTGKRDSITEVRDSDDLQAKVNDAGTNGYIRVHSGTHLTGGSPFTTGGAGQTWELLPGAELKQSAGDDLNRVIKPQHGDFVIKGDGTINANAQNQSSSNNSAVQSVQSGLLSGLTIRGVTLLNCNNALQNRQYSRFTVENVHFANPNNTESNPINHTVKDAGASMEQIHIVDCDFDGGFTNDGIVVESDTTGENADLVTIRGNTFKAPYATKGDGYSCIQIEARARQFSIQGNTARAEDGDGSGQFIVFRASGDGQSEMCSITGNVARGDGSTSGVRGIIVTGPDVSATGNTVLNYANVDIDVNDASAVVVGNRADSVGDGTGGSATIANNG